jgi:4-aminobutyrate aminotransferase
MSMPAGIDRTEGDINATGGRARWQRASLDEAARGVLAEDARVFVHQALSTPCLNALRACSGSWIEDEQGRRYLDFHGNSAHQVGYGHPRVVEAVRRQMEELPFCPRRYTNGPAVELARTLGELTGGVLARVLLAPAGTVAVSTAMKIARLATGRSGFVSMRGSFHGATLDAISLGGEAIFRESAGPLLEGVTHVEPCGPGWCGGVCGGVCAEKVERVLEARDGKVAAVVAEPVRCTTVAAPSAEYWQRVRTACDRHGVLLVFDEVPTCLGRTGRMFAYEHFGVTPDVLVIGKGLGGGVFPLAAVLVRDGLVDGSATALGHYTHEKSPVGAAAALATIGVIRDEGLVERSARLGAWFMERLAALRRKHPVVSDVRGLGLLMGVELGGADRERGMRAAERVMYACLDRGLSFKVSDGNVLTLTPALTLSDDEALLAVAALDGALKVAGV